MAVDMFLKLDKIEGESRDNAHAKEIDVLAWSWGMSNSGSAHMGGGAGAGKVSVQDLSLTKYIDKAVLTVRKAGGKPLEYVVIEMKEVLITSVSTGGSGGEDRLTENVSLNFAEYKLTYKSQKADGSDDATVEVSYNIAENKDT